MTDKTPPTEHAAIEAAEYLIKTVRNEITPDLRTMKAAGETLQAYTRHEAAVVAAERRALRNINRISKLEKKLGTAAEPVAARMAREHWQAEQDRRDKVLRDAGLT